ncbi:MAG: SIMPL domain-containing protein [Anaerolineae bacterium]|nr:SIMPL domain-containing protein [Anaerolineae bacterium]
MSWRVKRTFPMLLAMALATALVLVVSGCARPAEAAPEDTPPERTITVVGRGTASAKPDLALASLGVETFAASVAEATEENNTRMLAVLTRLKALGIAEADVQTSNFSINLERRDPEPSAGQYRVSNMLQVKVRDPEQVGAIIDAGVEAGVNQVWGVTFTVDDQGAFEGEARAKAMEDARKRAEALAGLAGVKIGEVLRVDENWMPGPIFGAGGAGAAEASLVPISPGEVVVSYQVQVTFAIQ